MVLQTLFIHHPDITLMVDWAQNTMLLTYSSSTAPWKHYFCGGGGGGGGTENHSFLNRHVKEFMLFEMSGASVTSFSVTNTHNSHFHSAHILEGVRDCPYIGETFSDLCVNDVFIPQLGICWKDEP